MKAVILSAGQGSRLLPLTKDTPKCLLSVGGNGNGNGSDTTLLGWQLTQLQAAGISEAVIVTGFYDDKVEAELARHELPTSTIYNPFYKAGDNLASVWMARSAMDSDFLLINGDTLFTSNVASRVLSRSGDGITLTIARKDIYDDDDMKVIEDQGRLLDIGKKLNRAAVNAESIGMIAFRGSGVETFRSHIDDRIRQPDSLSQYYLAIIDDLAKAERINVAEIPQGDWCEVDFTEDLERAREMVQVWSARSQSGKAA